MKAKWVVESKYSTKEEVEKSYITRGDDPNDYNIPDFSNVEISVIRANFKHGLKSYGWGGLTKIILFKDDDIYTKKNIKWCKRVAKIICDALNKGKS